MDLETLGWSPFFAAAFAPIAPAGWEPARVMREHRGGYLVCAAGGELKAAISGRLRHETRLASALPTVGDWVAVITQPVEARAIIQAVLPRQTKFARAAAGDSHEEQIIAANIDDVFIVTSLNRDLNLRRLERYLTLAWESGANPIIVLTKADLCDDVTAEVHRVESLDSGVPVHAVSTVTGQGLPELAARLRPGRTAVLLGSSGVGKSTLINFWYGGEHLKVQAIRESDDRGRHTTAHRELVLLPGGALLLDTPGMRELKLWESADGLTETFSDVAAFAARCRFTDCEHLSEPGCTVRNAIESGELDAARLESHRKLVAELRHQKRKQDPLAGAEERRRIKSATKNLRAHYRSPD